MRSRTREPRVLMVLESAFPAPRGGGAEAQVRTLARGLRKRGKPVTVLTPMFANGPQQRVSRVDGVPVCRLPYPRVRLLGGPLLWLLLARFLYRRRHRYDAWHVHIAHHVGAVCALMGHWLGKRVLVKVSGWWELERGTLAPRAWPLARLARRCLLLADGWQAISRRIASELVDIGIPPARIIHIPNAVDTVRFGGIKHPPAAPCFLFIGRIVAEKGLPTLLDAFADVVAAHPAVRIIVVGTGPLLESLRSRAVSSGIAGSVEFTGHRDDIESLLAEANIGVLPSRIEGLSNTLLECMASGLPVVASRISGNEDFIRHDDNGWLFEVDDSAALAECLLDAAALAPQQRDAMGARARATVESRASLDRVLDRLLEAYRGDPASLHGHTLRDGST